MGHKAVPTIRASQLSAMSCIKAKIRQLNNGRFLTCTAPSNQCRTELETGLQQANDKYYTSKEQWESALRDAEDSKRVSMRGGRRVHQGTHTIRRSKASGRQGSIVTENMGEMVKDLSLARKQTESLSRAKQATKERGGLQDRVAHYLNEISTMKNQAKSLCLKILHRLLSELQLRQA